MATYNPPKKNTAYITYVALRDQADTKLFKSTPTLATGDAKVSIDGAALANLATLPAVTPAASVMVKVSLSAAEMNGDNITLVFVDAAGSEWCDLVVNFQTVTNQFDDLSTFDVSSDTVDVGKISGDTTAANNLELMYDGTGYDAANSTIGTVTAITGLNDPTAAAISDAVWDEAIAGHAGAGSTGEALTDAGAAGATAAAVADAVWDEAVSGHVAAGSFGAEVQSHATSAEVTAATIAANSLASTGTASVHRGDTFTATFSALGDISARTKLWFTMKTSKDDLDSASLLQIEESGGLLYVNGVTATTSGNGSITVNNATTGNITIEVDETETALLSEADSLYYDIQMLDASDVTTLSDDSAVVVADVTRATA